MQDARLETLAHVLVNYSVAVQPGDLVRIDAPSVAEPGVVAVYEAVLEAGGNPVVRMRPEACAELKLRHGSQKQLKFVDPLEKFEVEKINVRIGFWAEENTKALTNTDPKKQAAAAKARKPIMDTFLRRAAIPRGKRGKLRWTGTQYPCQASAQDAKMSLREYEAFVYRAGLLHLPKPAAAWRKISTRQQRVCDYLDKRREIRFVTRNGTDLRLGIEGRRWINCDGHENFPDGEVFSAPIEDAVDGTVCYSFPAVHGGREVHDIRLVFRNGRVVDASAGKGEPFLFKMLDMDRGARSLGEIALGTNYAIKQYTCNTLFDEKIGGTFHAALGAGYPESGSQNKSGLHWDMVCDLRRGGRVEVDGKVISRNGRFLNAAWPSPAAGRK